MPSIPGGRRLVTFTVVLGLLAAAAPAGAAVVTDNKDPDKVRSTYQHDQTGHEFV